MPRMEIFKSIWKSEGGLGNFFMANSLENVDWYGILEDFTVGPHEDIGKFPNCLNSIPNEYLGLKKEIEQKIFVSVYGKKMFTNA